MVLKNGTMSLLLTIQLIHKLRMVCSSVFNLCIWATKDYCYLLY